MNSHPPIKKKILILSANPKGTEPLRLDEEIREIKEKLQLAKNRDRFTVETAEAVRVRDISQNILKFEPNIVHFSGHGLGGASPRGDDLGTRHLDVVRDTNSVPEGLVFEDDETGQVKLVSGEALAELFKLFTDKVECVLLNACYSVVQAEAIAQHIPYVVGMSKAIGDRAAIEYAVGFYSALGAGKPYEFAHRMGCVAVKMQGITEDLTPHLLGKGREGLIPPETPEDIQLKDELPNDVITKIGESLLNGKLIFFLGPGINYSLDRKTNNLPPSDIYIAKKIFGLEVIDKEDITEILGLPCQACPAKLESRPPHSCPIWKKINESSSSQQLCDEQDLAFARLEMRCFSQHVLNRCGSTGLNKNLRRILKKNCEPNEVQITLADLAEKLSQNNKLSRFLILTTNYDVGLEEAFAEKLDFDVMNYFIDVATDESNCSGQFWHKSYFLDESKNNDGLGEIVLNRECDLQPTTIFKLYGGVLYKEAFKYDSFAIAESHFINYLPNPRENFPDYLTNYLDGSNILFLGCNPNDADILALLHRFFPKRFSTTPEKPDGWFINRLIPGTIHDWTEMRITLIDKCSSEYLLTKLNEYVEQNIKKEVSL